MREAGYVNGRFVDIAVMGAKDLDQVMETVPGVHVSRSAPYYTSLYTIRGIVGDPTNPQVLVLQNGIPINSVYRGDSGESSPGVPLENVARIEVIRGPGSALYGADAYSGVINIITKTAADTPGTEFGVRGGSFNSKDAWVQHGGKWGTVDVASYLRVGSTDGYKQTITADAATRLDNLFHTHASLAPGPVNTGYDAVDGSVNFGYDKWRLNAAYKLRDNVGMGAGVSSALDPVGKEKSERITTDLSWTDPGFSKDWGLSFTGSYLYYTEQASNYNLYPPGTTFPTGTFPNGMIGSPGRWEQQLRISGNATYSGFANQSLRIGLGHDDLNLYNTRTLKNFYLTPSGTPSPDLGFNGGAVVDYSGRQPHLTPHERKIDYLYAQDEWNFARDWTLTAGVRHDNYSDFGGTTNPRLAVVWDTTLDLTAKLLYGQAFRAPAYIEQYSINPSNNGNPNLTPETMKTLEAAFSWQARKDTQVNLNLFRYDMANIIRSVLNLTAGTGSTYQNTGKQHGSGMELEAVWDASRTVRLTGNYSYQKSIDEATNQDAGIAPHDHVYVRSDWRFANSWLSSTQINRVMNRLRAAGDTRPPVPDYTTVDISMHTNGKNQWDYSASVLNLFNATVLEPSITGSLIPNDLPMAPRSVWLQVMRKL